MSFFLFNTGVCGRVLAGIVAVTLAVPTVFASGPKVFYADPQALADAKAKFQSKNPSLLPAFERLLADAHDALRQESPSVMEKRRIPPSGDKHDFVSQAPYFWPDTNSPGGRYIRRDGERNPESNIDSDAGRMGRVFGNTHTLALAYYFTGDEKYAAKAAQYIRVWFLDPATRMNPNMNFGQGIPGEVDGRAAGLIGARGFVQFVDALALIEGSKAWTPADQKGMVDWMTDYFTWLRTSKIGISEGDASNNHGTFYDTQAVAIAMFLGKDDVARQIVTTARDKRIAKQIQPDGSMPRELQRTKSFGYSLFNLRALEDLASLGQNLGIDLWHFQTPDGRSIRKAMEFMAVYADSTQKWPRQQIGEFNRGGIGPLLLRAAPQYPEAQFESRLRFFTADTLAPNRERLIFRTAPLDVGLKTGGRTLSAADSSQAVRNP
jgi:hypothetical protein